MREIREEELVYVADWARSRSEGVCRWMVDEVLPSGFTFALWMIDDEHYEWSSLGTWEYDGRNSITKRGEW